MTREDLLSTLPGLQAERLDLWVARAWVRPDDGTVFAEIDVARVRLIRELRDDLGIDDDSLPVVLSLIDQLYAARRQMRKLRRAVEEAAPDAVRQAILDTLAGGGAAEAGEG